MTEKPLTPPELPLEEFNDLAAELSGTPTDTEILEIVENEGALPGTTTPPAGQIRMPVEDKRRETNPVRKLFSKS